MLKLVYIILAMGFMGASAFGYSLSGYTLFATDMVEPEHQKQLDNTIRMGLMAGLIAQLLSMLCIALAVRG